MTSITDTERNDDMVSMPSRASTSLLREQYSVSLEESMVCQCPLGLVPHCYVYYTLFTSVLRIVSMPSRASTSLLRISRCVSHRRDANWCQCPLGLVPHCYESYTGRLTAIVDVSMPSRASTSLLRG